ncbi:MAG: DUF5333 domain-containing protein [Pseudomonadota bacterium]
MNMPTGLILGVATAVGVALLSTVVAARADEFDALREDPQIENGVLIVAIAEQFRDNCPNLEDRRGRSMAFLFGLVNRANALGYNRAQIEAYVENDADQARVEARARQWLVQEGANLDEPESICQVARDEITNQTVIGRLIRER